MRRVWIEKRKSSLKRGVFKDDGCKMMGLSLKRGDFKDECQSDSGPVGSCWFRAGWIRRTRKWGFGVRIGKKDGRRTRIGLFGVRQ